MESLEGISLEKGIENVMKKVAQDAAVQQELMAVLGPLAQQLMAALTVEQQAELLKKVKAGR